MKNMMRKYVKLSACVLMASLMTGCTGKFEEYNTNPFWTDSARYARR